MLAALGRGIARRPGLIVLAWLILTIAGFAAATGAFGEGLFARLNAGEATVNSESSEGREILNAASTTGPSLSLIVQDADPADPALAEPLDRRPHGPAGDPRYGQVVDPLAVPGGPGSPAAAGLIAKDGNGFLVSATLEPDLPDDVQDASLDAAQARLRAAVGARSPRLVPGATGQVGGGTLLFDAITGQVEKDLVSGELIALPISLLVMVLVFGGFLAAGMPIVGAIASIGGGAGHPAGLLLPDRPRRRRGQCGHRARAGPVHRLRPADRLPLPGGTARAAGGDHHPVHQGGPHRGLGRDHVHRRPHGDVLRGHGRDQPVRPAALRGPDPARGRRRRGQRGRRRAAGGADPGPGAAGAGRRQDGPARGCSAGSPGCAG